MNSRHTASQAKRRRRALITISVAVCLTAFLIGLATALPAPAGVDAQSSSVTLAAGESLEIFCLAEDGDGWIVGPLQLTVD